MRKFYKTRRNRLIGTIGTCPVSDRLEILEENAGLHFLVKVHTQLTDEALVERCRQLGIRVRALSSYYQGDVPDWAAGCLVVNYSALTDEQLNALEEKLRLL